MKNLDITASLSILGAVVSLASMLTGFLKIRHERKKLRAEREKWAQDYKLNFATKLFDKRLEEYAALNKQLSRLRKFSSNKLEEVDRQKFITIHGEINTIRKGILGLVMSKKSYSLLQDLLRSLKKEPANNGVYAIEQTDKIWQLKNSLLESLRNDLGTDTYFSKTTTDDKD